MMWRRALCTAASGAREVMLERSSGGVATVTLNRPATRNAIGKQFLAELRAAVAEVRFDETVRCVVLRSAVDKVFCAGADLKERAQMDQRQVAEFVFGLRSAFSEVETLPMPTIAAIEGFALGGGAELALACDLRVVGENAKLGFPETGLAIIPGAGGTQRLPRLIGACKAKELIFTARVLGAEQAVGVGLANYAVEAGQAEAKALELAGEILPRGPVAVRMAKAAIDQGMQTDRETGMAIERACYAQVIPTKDRVEGLTAFKEKRKPVYEGK